MPEANFAPQAVKSGHKDWGYVNVVDTLAVQFDMPVMVINGAANGPTLTVTAGLFPLEFCGQKNPVKNPTSCEKPWCL